MNKPERIVFTYVIGSERLQIELAANSRGRLPELVFNNYACIESMVCNDREEQSIEIKDRREAEQRINDWINDGTIVQSSTAVAIPSISYADITEHIILGSEKISKENLESKEHGMWANYGIRKLEVSGLPQLDDLPQLKNGKRYMQIKFKRINDDVCSAYNLDMPINSCVKIENTVLVDTDVLGELFNEEAYKDRKYLHFIGDIEYVIEDKYRSRITFRYPICIALRNTAENMGLVSSKYASIDFGTSSTCVAVQNGIKAELLTLTESETDEDVNQYENPTNFMIFNWETLYEQWKEENSCPPIMYKGNEQLMCAGQRADYNFGYEVKTLMGEAKKKELVSIMSLIKMVHYNAANGMQMDINPFLQPEKYVYIVTSPQEQDETHFDPVAFYGYLIGKAINDQSKRECIYNRFKITCPVKFNDEVKAGLKASLEYGLKRALPKNLRESAKISMEIQEPVAYIGALCGTPYFRIESGEKKNFAVFDFGGGTLDFSYGTVINDGEEEELSIKILGVGGNENIGGEKLIERISFNIYVNNISAMKEYRIPIIMPVDEEMPDELNSQLIAKSSFAHANTNRINELISRKIFENSGEPSNPLTMMLFNEDGEECEVQLSFETDDIKLKLEEMIESSVRRFSSEMDRAFADEADYDRDEVWIFKAGNSSKNEFVDVHMNKIFGGNKHIQMVDQIEDRSEEYKRYAITPKTAVAYGQLKLQNVNLIISDLLFKYYVGFINMGTNRFITKLAKNSSDTKTWQRFKKIKDSTVDVFYTDSEEDETAEKYFKTVNTAEYIGRNLYVRIVDEKTIECAADNEDGDGVDVITTLVLDRR